MTQVVVENVLWSGRGAIFNGIANGTGAKHRIVASRLVMPREPVPGEVWNVSGVIRKHPKYGPQVEASSATLLRPSGRLIVGTIAKSPAFRGIGEVRANRLWDAFGEKIYELLDTGDPAPFIDLLGGDLAGALVEGWKAISVDAAVYQWLDRHGVGPALARSIVTIYGPDAVKALEDNPYRLLAFSAWGMVDALARSMGVALDDDQRRVAAVDAVVYRRLQSSHTVCDEAAFTSQLRKTLGCNAEAACEALGAGLNAHAVIRVGQGLQGLGPASMERFIAQRIVAMASGAFEPEQGTLRAPVDFDRIADEFRSREGLDLNSEQRKAVQIASTQPVCCITGGAGVGKTTVLRAVHAAIERSGGAVIQMALAGRAALRMQEATLRPAMTIARFVKDVDNGRTALDRGQTVVIDEASMVDLPTMYRVLRRMQPGSRLVMVGDHAQLPPIGFGLCFHSLVAAENVPRIELTQIHRAAAETGIPQTSVAIRNGSVPNLPKYEGRRPGVTFVEASPQEITERVLEVVNDLGGVAESQVIGAVKAGRAGVRTINTMFHELLTPGRVESGGFAEGEPVIWTVNNYDLGLMNGSLGTVISAVDPDSIGVDFEGADMTIPHTDLGDMEHAYAITCHKAQGSQFRRVIVPVLPSRLLDRTLLYTAVTRAREQVVLIGNRQAFEDAVKAPPNPSRRETGMEHHLCQAHEGALAEGVGVAYSWITGMF